MGEILHAQLLRRVIKAKWPHVTSVRPLCGAYRWRDSNPRPVLRQKTALSTELQRYAERKVDYFLNLIKEIVKVVDNSDTFS